MDKDRIAGTAKEIKVSVKETIGKAVGDAKLQSDGKADKIEGKVQNAVGGLKDALKPEAPQGNATSQGKPDHEERDGSRQCGNDQPRPPLRQRRRAGHDR